MANKHYVGDVGTEIIVDCGCEIVGATELKLIVKKPGGTLVEWVPTVYNSNYLKYTIIANDWDEEGCYRLQASLTLGDWSGLGETVEFVIYASFG